MRIAISGTHGCGKSTLIEAFLERHREFAHEPEPYETLEGTYGEAFSAEPTAEEFYRQLEFQASRLTSAGLAEKVIFERCPADFLAYLLALEDLGRETSDETATRQALRVVRESIQRLDLILFLTPGGSHELSESEDLELRDAMNERLAEILFDGDPSVFGDSRALILEAEGTTLQRLRLLESAVERQLNK